MFTLKGGLVGLTAVIVLFVAMFLYKAFSQVGASRTSGPAVLLADLSGVITSVAFRLCAVVIFFATAFLAGKYQLSEHS